MTSSTGAVDGRVARGVRTREAVVAAFEELITERGKGPTASELAKRAGVSCRSIFSHFGDMDGVMSAAARRLFDHLSDAHVPISRQLPVDERIEAFVVQRARTLDITAPFYRAVMAQTSPSPALSQLLNEAMELARADTMFVFRAELSGVEDGLCEDLEEAMLVVTSWHHWEGLRGVQLLSLPQASAVMRLELRGLLGRSAAQTATATAEAVES
jgi:TetR/AcrR family transcriptional regulator of autoinduction and epiphytic fitness